MNYTHLFPMFCVSIAFCLGGVPIVGVIYAPVLDTTYSALAGHGAYQDDAHASKPRKKLPLINGPKAILGPQAPKGCIFSCEWGKDRRDVEGGNMMRKIGSFVNMAAEIGGRGGKGGMVHGVRSLGRSAFSLLISFPLLCLYPYRSISVSIFVLISFISNMKHDTTHTQAILNLTDSLISEIVQQWI